LTFRKRCKESNGFKMLPNIAVQCSSLRFGYQCQLLLLVSTIHTLLKNTIHQTRFCPAKFLLMLEYILILKASRVYLTLPVRIAVGKIFSDSHFFLSFSVFFISSSSCLQFSSWALLNILVKLTKVDATAENSK